MEKKIRKRVGTLPSTDMASSGLIETTYFDSRGELTKTVHSGGFSVGSLINYLYFEANSANSSVSLKSSLISAPELEYSTDGVYFYSWGYETEGGVHTFDEITLSNAGDRVYIRGGEYAMAYSESHFSAFVLDGDISAGGSVTSLLDGCGTSLVTIPEYAFYGLFSSFDGQTYNTALKSAPGFGNTAAIGDHSAALMYEGCLNLTAAADMSDILAIGEEGCWSMYKDCTSLVDAADMGDVSDFGTSACADMYKGC